MTRVRKLPWWRVLIVLAVASGAFLPTMAGALAVNDPLTKLADEGTASTIKQAFGGSPLTGSSMTVYTNSTALAGLRFFRLNGPALCVEKYCPTVLWSAKDNRAVLLFMSTADLGVDAARGSAREMIIFVAVTTPCGLVRMRISEIADPSVSWCDGGDRHK